MGRMMRPDLICAAALGALILSASAAALPAPPGSAASLAGEISRVEAEVDHTFAVDPARQLPAAIARGAQLDGDVLHLGRQHSDQVRERHGTKNNTCSGAASSTPGSNSYTQPSTVSVGDRWITVCGNSGVM